jgi:hypothetical protein
MRAYPIVSRTARLIIAAGLTLVFPLSGLALDRTSGATLTVTVFADQYIADDVAFADLDALNALVQPANPTVLRLDGCGPASADALLAAAERFRGSYLEIRVLAGTERACTAAAPEGAVRVSQVGRAVPLRAGHAPTDAYWRSVMP